MIINCTNKFQKNLKVKLEKEEIGDPILSWHGDIITLNRRKTLVLVNDLSKFVIILFGLQAKDFENIGELIKEGIKKSFLKYGIKENIVDKYLHEAKSIKFSKSQSQSELSYLIGVKREVDYYEYCIKDGYTFQEELSSKISDKFIYKILDFKSSGEMLVKELEERYKTDVYQIDGAILEINLNLLNDRVKREAIIPLNYNFLQLHEVLQVLYGWYNYHLYKFELSDSEITNIVSKKLYEEYEDFSYENIDLIYIDKETLLSEVFTKNKNIKYFYDFGDGWEIDIKLKKVVKEYNKNISTCILADKNSPPEDIGGVYGYQEFLEIINNPKSTNDVGIEEWLENTDYEDVDLKEINTRLEEYILWCLE